MSELSRGQQIDKYTVQSLIKENLYTETYRVEDEEGNPFFMKLFIIKRLPEKLLDTTSGNVKEIEFAQLLKHRNLVSFIGKGSFEGAEGECKYYLTNYFNGELLAEKIQREGKIGPEEAVAIYRDILAGLQHMHGLGVIHNDITPRNVMIVNGTAEIIDMGHCSKPCDGRTTFDTADLEVLYSANETFGAIYEVRSDIFAATAVLYAMLSGEAPWTMDFDPAMKRARKAMLIKEKRKQEELPLEKLDVDAKLRAILAKGLAPSYNERFTSVDDILEALDSEMESMPGTAKTSEPPKPQSGKDKGQGNEESPNKVDFEIRRGGGKGFKDIAGMDDLKTYLSQRVIFVIKNKEKAEKYKLSTPNGMLLYGPPGCGKTFVAEKFAEETGFNFILVKSSDLASSFLHGSQEKIAQLFNVAEKNAPIVICFDEFDALVPDRSNPAAQQTASEVNEFLSQLNNCARRGIFVVGTTNRPDKIDPAVLRTGRIDKQVYVPLPDKEARREMFQLHLEGRPIADGEIDLEMLSTLSDGFIASDIAYVVNDAAMIAAFTDQNITGEILESSVRNTHPSLSPETLDIYAEIQRKMDTTERRSLARPKIGFNT